MASRTSRASMASGGPRSSMWSDARGASRLSTASSVTFADEVSGDSDSDKDPDKDADKDADKDPDRDDRDPHTSRDPDRDDRDPHTSDGREDKRENERGNENDDSGDEAAREKAKKMVFQKWNVIRLYKNIGSIKIIEMVFQTSRVVLI
jgi:hypothetical protein